jgi:hypothetical protein
MPSINESIAKKGFETSNDYSLLLKLLNDGYSPPLYLQNPKDINLFFIGGIIKQGYFIEITIQKYYYIFKKSDYEDLINFLTEKKAFFIIPNQTL